MGTLIPIGLGADAEIKDLLNQIFNDANFKALQAHVQNKNGKGDPNLFGPGHLYRTARVASRMKLHPANGDKKKRWYYLLRNILPTASDGSTDGSGNTITTEEALKAALTIALLDSKFKRIAFDAEEQSGAPAHYIYPSNASPGLVVGQTMNIILVCPKSLDDNVSNSPIPDTDPDPAEKPLPTISVTLRKWRLKREVVTAKDRSRKATTAAKKSKKSSARKDSAKSKKGKKK